MHRDYLETNWSELKVKAQRRWDKLTDKDFAIIAGNREQLVANIQRRYVIKWEAAEGQVDSFSW